MDASHLVALREEAGLSQTRLAQRAELNPATMNQIEKGRRQPSFTTLTKISGALSEALGREVTVPELLSPKGAAPTSRPKGEEERRSSDADLTIEDVKELIGDADLTIADAMEQIFPSALRRPRPHGEPVYGLSQVQRALEEASIPKDEQRRVLRALQALVPDKQ